MKNEEENLEMNDTSTASRRDRLRRPPPPEPPQRGSGSAVSSPASSDHPPRGPASAVSNPPPRSSVRGVGVVASRVAAMTSTGSSSPGVSRSPTRQLSADSTSTVNARRLVSYRLSSLDRLAQRQKLFEQNGISSSLTSEPSVTPASTSATTLPALQSKRDLFFKNDPPAAAAASTTTATAATATTAAAAAPLPSQNSINSVTTATTASTTVAAAPTTAAGISTSTSNATTAVAGGIASLKESLLASKENHVTTAPTNGSTSITTSSSSSSVTGSKIEALKRELAEDNREREKAILREKGPAPVPPAAASKTREVDYVGFANLPNQVYRRAVKKGFEFTLMVVGESGLGKSTLINSMFLADIYSPEYPGPSQRIKKTVNVEQCQVLLKESGVNLTLTVVDTPGFGDAVDNSNCWQPIVDFIESKYEEYLNAESRVFRQAISDNRVHVCLYFVAPTGHGLKPLDVEFMKRLHDKVNIIPVIAKADTMTPDECAHFKKQVLNEIAQHKIRIYEFPDADDEETRKEQRGMRERVPFAVVGSNTVVEVDGRKLRGRRYPWGVVEVENMEHCDFIALRNMLIRTHMTDLKEVTSSVHYENFRCRKLAGVGVATNDGKSNRVSNKNPLAQMEEERREHETKLKKMEQEMEQVFEMKVKEKTQKLKDSEVDLQRRHEQMMCSLESQKNEMDEKRKAFESEKSAWESSVGITLEELRRRSLESNSKEQVDGKDKSDKGKKKKGLF